jgi:hypothetical protein
MIKCYEEESVLFTDGIYLPEEIKGETLKRR